MKQRKQTVIKLILTGLFIIGLLLFSGCDQGLDTDVSNTEGGYVTLNLSGVMDTSRTVTVSEPTIARYVLFGAATGGTQTELGNWTSLSSASVTLATGTWDFTLKAYSSSSDDNEVLEGALSNQTITGSGSLVFTLYTIQSGTGAVDVTVKWPSADNIVTTVSITFDGETGDDITHFDESGDYYTVSYDKSSVTAGDKVLVFKLLDGSNVVATVFEQVKVRKNLTSSKTITLTSDDLNAGPTAPGGVSAALVAGTGTAGAVKTSWTDASNTETGFVIYRQAGSDTAEEVGSVDAGVEEYTDSTAVRGTTYTYSVLAKNDFGESSAIAATDSVTIPYLVKFDLDGGNIGGDTTNPTSQEVAPNGTATLPGDPVKTGYAFGGWYTEQGGSGTRYTNETTVTGNMILYAKWLTVYSITYNLDNGINSTDNPETYTIETDTITLAAPTRDNCTFAGWYSDVAYTSAVTEIAKGSTGNKTLYAKWTPHQGISATESYLGEGTIVFSDGNGNTLSGSTSVNKGESLTITVSSVNSVTENLSNSAYYTYQWYLDGDEMTGETGQSLSFDTSATGIYSLTVFITQSAYDEFSRSITVTVTN